MDWSQWQEGCLLDLRHLIAFIYCLFSHKWLYVFKIETSIAILIRQTIDLFVPLEKDGISELRKSILADFMVSTHYV